MIRTQMFELFSSEWDEEKNIADDDKPFATLSYANGPGFYTHRTNLTEREEKPRRDLTPLRDEMRT